MMKMMMKMMMILMRIMIQDPSIGAMVVTGNEKAFAAGADIKEMQDEDFAFLYMNRYLVFGAFLYMNRYLVF